MRHTIADSPFCLGSLIRLIRTSKEKSSFELKLEKALVKN